jgi:hypothetical protein
VSGGKNQNVINEADLRQMNPAERRELARMLAAIDYPHPLLDLNRGRRLGAVFSAIACVVLAAWIVVLVLTLHKHYTATHWRLAWVGFDMVELVAFAVTAWAFWRGRQIVIACLLITGTLLCCDAWFDVILDLGTSDMWMSIASAVFIELPLAFLLLNAARRLIRLSALVAVSERGDEAVPLPSLWRVPLPVPPAILQAGMAPQDPQDLAFGHGYRFHRGNRRRCRHRQPWADDRTEAAGDPY